MSVYTHKYRYTYTYVSLYGHIRTVGLYLCNTVYACNVYKHICMHAKTYIFTQIKGLGTIYTPGVFSPKFCPTPLSHLSQDHMLDVLSFDNSRTNSTPNYYC